MLPIIMPVNLVGRLYEEEHIVHRYILIRFFYPGWFNFNSSTKCLRRLLRYKNKNADPLPEEWSRKIRLFKADKGSPGKYTNPAYNEYARSNATPFTAQLVVPLVLPLKETTQPKACDPRVWPGIAGAGILFALTGILAQIIRSRSFNQAASLDEYSTESHANESYLRVQIGHVDFDGGSSNAQASNPLGPIALIVTGIVLIVGGGVGTLNLIPCTAWMGTIAVSVFAGLASVMIGLMFGKGGMRLFMSGKLKVTGNKELARKINNDLDEQK
jgi:hypothetical protein